MSSKKSVFVLYGLITVVVFFHLAIVFKIIPYSITWGGKLKTDEEMYVFESFSIAINVLLLWFLAMWNGQVKQSINIGVVRVVLYCFLGLFALNTIANLFAETNFEKYLALLTLAFAVLLWFALKRKPTGANA